MHSRYELARCDDRRLALGRRSLQVLAAILTLLLAACASTPDIPHTYRPAQPPSAQAVKEGVRKGATAAKLTGGLEISAVRRTDHGPGSYFVCVRRSDPSADGAAYSVFFDNDDFKGIQSSVISEACEAGPWVPFK